MRGKTTACFFLLASLMTPAMSMADEELAPGYNQCQENADNMAANIECATKAFQYWDKQLNNNFKNAKNLCANAENPEACHSELLKAQRLWIQYKETMGNALFQINGGGSIARLESDIFIARETKKQAQLLEANEE